MPEICCAGVDKHLGHFSTTPNPFHQTSYVAGGNSKVSIGGNLVIVQGDSTGCGDVAVGASSRVFVGGIGVHRKGDSTSGHGSWIPNAAGTGSAKVSAA